MSYSKFILLFLLVFTPLAFGTVEPWSYALMEILAGAGILAFLTALVRKKTGLHEIPGLNFLVLFLGYHLFQIIPLPPSMVEWLSPNAHIIQKNAFALTESSGWMRLSLNPGATLSEFFRYGTYVVVYMLTVQLLKERDYLQISVFTIAIFGGILAFSSILQFYLTTDMALWFRHSPNNSIIMGPYVNHNHYAGLMEMIFPIVLALFFFYRPRRAGHHGSLIRGIVEILNQEKANIHILIGASALIIIVSIFVSLSRGAMISISLSLILFSFLLLQRRISKSNTILLMGLVMAAGLAVSWFGWDQIIDRFARLKNAHGIIHEGRLDFWKDTIIYIREFSLTGSGMGTFIHTYPSYKSLIDQRTLTHAHNDYLELFAEGGIIGVCIMAGFLITLFIKTYPVFKTRRDGFSIYIYMGSLTAMVSILLHSITDFNMHIGANGLWFFFTAGLAVSAANTNIRRKTTLTRLKPVSSTFKIKTFIFTGSLFGVSAILFNISGLMASLYFNTIKDVEMNRQTDPAILEKVQLASDTTLKFNPLHAEAYYLKANAAWLARNTDLAEDNFKAAICIDPLNYRYLKRYGTFLALQDPGPKAGEAFRLSTRYAPTLAEYAFKYGSWLLSEDQKKLGMEWMEKTLELDENYSDRALSAMILSGLNIDEIRTAIPDSPGALLSFSEFLYTIGKQSQAVQMHMNALDLIQKTDRKASNLYYKIYGFFLAHGNLKNAEQAMLKAENTFPDRPHIKITLGDLYRNQGILYKARDKYEQALFLDPKNQKAFQKLKKMDALTKTE